MQVIRTANANRARKKTQFSDEKKNGKTWMISLYIESSSMNDYEYVEIALNKKRSIRNNQELN
jgi:hypothetical protein